MLRRGIALWDVLASCVIRGADDASIREPKPNDIGALLHAAPIRAVFTTGKKAFSLYSKLCLPQTGVQAISLPPPQARRTAVCRTIRCWKPTARFCLFWKAPAFPEKKIRHVGCKTGGTGFIM